MTKVADILRRNWFYPLALGLLGLVWMVSRTAIGQVPESDQGWLEAALLVDVFVTLPLLFWFCFRRQLARKQLALGIIATMCGGLWAATWIVPVKDQFVLGQIGWVRYVGMALLLVFEIGIVVAAVRLIWKPKADARDFEALGVPPFVAKLMHAEARFWRWLFGKFRK